jgi:pseudouridine synthase
MPRGSGTPGLSRINKVLASAGLGSRRQVEELILQGRVDVDGQAVTDLGTRVDPRTAKIKVDGSLLRLPRLVYYALNKPKGVLSTNWDPSGRLRVIDLVPDRQRVFSVGRLDLHSEGLILLTNDGELAQRLAHPRFRIQKCYFVVVAGAMTREELNRLRKGVYLAEGVARIDGARIRKVRKTCTELEIILSEGKNREIRRILARAGHKVVLLRRIAIGPLRLGELPVGAARQLTAQEVKSLFESTSPQNRSKQSDGRKIKSDLMETEELPVQELDAGSYKGGKSTVVQGKGGEGAALSVSVTNPFESGDDDFGLGGEQETSYDESVLSQNWEDEQWEAEGDDQWDDDFAIDLSNLNKTGRILVDEIQDDSQAALKPPRGRKTQRIAAEGASGRRSGPQSRRSSSSGSAEPASDKPRRIAGAKKSPNKSFKGKSSKGKPAADRPAVKGKRSQPKGAAGKSPRGGKRKGR